MNKQEMPLATIQLYPSPVILDYKDDDNYNPLNKSITNANLRKAQKKWRTAKKHYVLGKDGKRRPETYEERQLRGARYYRGTPGSLEAEEKKQPVNPMDYMIPVKTSEGIRFVSVEGNMDVYEYSPKRGVGKNPHVKGTINWHKHESEKHDRLGNTKKSNYHDEVGFAIMAAISGRSPREITPKHLASYGLTPAHVAPELAESFNPTLKKKHPRGKGDSGVDKNILIPLLTPDGIKHTTKEALDASIRRSVRGRTKPSGRTLPDMDKGKRLKEYNPRDRRELSALKGADKYLSGDEKPLSEPNPHKVGSEDWHTHEYHKHNELSFHYGGTKKWAPEGRSRLPKSERLKRMAFHERKVTSHLKYMPVD